MANIYKNEMFTLANTGSKLVYTVPTDTRAIVKTIQVQSNVSNATVTLSAHTSGKARAIFCPKQSTHFWKNQGHF